MMTYLLQVSTCWIVLYAIYILFLQKETFFNINRYYLLGALTLGLAIPFLGSLLPANETSTEIFYVMSQVSPIEISTSMEQSKPIFTWINLLYFIYAIGALTVFSRFIYGLTRIFNIYRGATKKIYKQYTLLESPHYHLPFSFFHFIFISTKVPLNKDIEKILKHEELHANQWHSLDIVLIELLQVFFWFNPILIFYKKAIRQSHEFLADAYVTREHKKSSYGQLLLRQSTSGLEIALANHFFHSQIKKRITMMYKEKSKRSAMVKYLVAIPVLAAMLFIFSSSKAEDKLLNTVTDVTVEESYSSFPLAINIDDKGRYYYNSWEMEFSKLSEILDEIPQPQNQQGDPIFKVVEEMPRFPGCESIEGSAAEKERCAKEKMLEYIYSQVQYPEKARKNNIQGITVIQFVVMKDGTISDGKIVRDIGGDAGTESLRVVNSMPIWIPGKQKGVPVNVQYTLPIKYKLESIKISEQETIQFANVVAIGDKSEAAIKENLVINQQKPVQENNDKGELFRVVEEMPRFIGCENNDLSLEDLYKCSRQKMLEYIYTNIKYPSEARNKGIEGTVVIELVIEKDGSVSSSHILRDPGAGTGAEAKRVIDEMPNWVPGKQRGKNVRVQYILPIKYKLEGDKGTELFQNAPNPFREQTKIGFNLTKAGPATITVFNVAGEEIAQKNINGKKGYNSVSFTASELNTIGVLYYTMKSGEFKATRKMSIIKPKESISLEIKQNVFANLKHIRPILEAAGIKSDCSVEKFELACLSQSKDPTIYQMKKEEFTNECIKSIKDTKVGDKIFIEKLALQCDGSSKNNKSIVINIIENENSEKLDVKNLIISPNPSNGLFSLSFDINDKTATNILFYNASGQIIKTLNNVNIPFNESIDLTKYKGQTIYAKIAQGEKVHTEKIIVH